MDPNSLAARDIETLIHPYANLQIHRDKGPLILERGKGIYVWDRDGKKYIEGLAGLWCTALGFGEEALVEAASVQLRKLPYYHLFGDKSQGPAIEPVLKHEYSEIRSAPRRERFFHPAS